MKKATTALIVGLSLLASVALAGDQCADGDYTYNDGNGSQDAVVALDGAYMEIGTLPGPVKQFIWNELLGAYVIHPGAGDTIVWRDQEYRYIGVRTEGEDQRVCTLYPK